MIRNFSRLTRTIKDFGHIRTIAKRSLPFVMPANYTMNWGEPAIPTLPDFFQESDKTNHQII